MNIGNGDILKWAAILFCIGMIVLSALLLIPPKKSDDVSYFSEGEEQNHVVIYRRFSIYDANAQKIVQTITGPCYGKRYLMRSSVSIFCKGDNGYKATDHIIIGNGITVFTNDIDPDPEFYQRKVQDGE